MLREQPNPDRRKFFTYLVSLTLAISLAAVFDRCVLHDQDAPNSQSASLTVYSIFIFLGLISAMLFSGEEGNGFKYLCCGCNLSCLFSRAEQPVATDSTGLLGAASDVNYGTGASIQ